MMFVPQGDMLGLIDRAYQLVSLASLTDLSVVELPYIDQVCQFPAATGVTCFASVARRRVRQQTFECHGEPGKHETIRARDIG